VKYLLDTNICINLINQRATGAAMKRLLVCKPGDIGISSITVAELSYGAAKSKSIEKNAQALHAFLVPLEILPFDEAAAIVYGGIRAQLERAGKPIGSLDNLIAAQAVSENLVLATNNTKEFCRVPNLRVEDWLAPE
jgi:tRNA(fMet)-specific endonuclease VapC